MFKIKNISNKPVSLFYVKGGKNARTTLAPGQELVTDSTRTTQISFFENSGKISVSNTDSNIAMPAVTRIITDNAIFPNKQISAEDYLLNKERELNNMIEKDIPKLIENNKFNYIDIVNNNVSVLFNKDKFFDISVIVPVRGRNSFSEPMYKSFLAAAEKSELNISYTMVEHSENPEHSKFCKKNNISYFWIKSTPGELFNKCLAQNIGAIFSNNSKYILFHDIDCLVQTNFFIKLLDNINKKNARAIQNFTGRRVLYINPELTQKVINGEFDVDNLSLELPEIQLPSLTGAPGGSITIERELFFDIGGYDPELFLANSPEDAFFWEKVETISKMHIADEPAIEMYHMYHPPTYMDNPHIGEMSDIFSTFKSISEERKKDIIKLKSNIIKDLIKK